MTTLRVFSDSAPAVSLLGATTATGGVSAGDTNMVLSASLNTYFNSTFPFELRIEPDTANEEIVLVASGTGQVGTPYVVTRGYSNGVTGSNLTAKAHSQGAAVRHGFSAVDVGDAITHVNVGRTTHGSAVAGERVSSGMAPVSSTVTVGNTTTETVVGTYTIPANDGVAGSLYALVVGGTFDNVITAVPTITVRARLGGLAGTLLGSAVVFTANVVAQTNRAWRSEIELELVSSPGAGAQWRAIMQHSFNLGNATTQPATSAVDATAAAVALTSASSQALVITVQWSAANAANILRADSGYTRRIY